MGKWWKFGFGRGKDQDQGAGAEQTPQEPTPPPAPEAAPAAAPKEKKAGFFGRLFGRGRKKEKEGGPAETPTSEAPPAPPSGPTPPAAPAAGGPSDEGGSGGGGGGEGEGAGKEEEEKRVFPSSIDASVDGTWVISDSVWRNVISGTITGKDVKAFILAVERGKEDIAIRLLADAYDYQDMGFARYLDIKASSWGTIEYS
ncbi:hypothetical protein ABT391_36785 [Streptomyces jumonjinensis]|uniref:hypothetical protein n=1 Tax=Streptomyces jumonjinensis TaxID=1945 RepID=UPI00331693C7